MAQFSYEAYVAQQEARKATNGGNGMGPQVHFMNEFLKNDGDVAVVRFPYHSMSDITFESTHSVTFPGKKWPTRVRCEGPDCPLCKQGIKVDNRFFVKMLVYDVVNEASDSVQPLNVVWDRASAFADIDIKNLMQEYGDISQYLFKIKRNGQGTATRYTISIVMNTTVYNPEVYKADFTELNKVDAAKILSKSYKQYLEAVHPEMVQQAQTTQVNAQPAYIAPAQPAQPAYTAPAQPAQPAQPAYGYTAPAQTAPAYQVNANQGKVNPYTQETAQPAQSQHAKYVFKDGEVTQPKEPQGPKIVF